MKSNMVLEQKRNTLNKKNALFQTRKGNFKTELVSKTKKRVLSVGDICNLKISALAPNNIGIDEYSFPYAIFVPISGLSAEVGLGSEIKAKIVKIQDSSYAVAQFMEEKVQKDTLRKASVTTVPVKPGDVLTVSLNKKLSKGNIGIVELENNYKLVVPLSTEETNNLTLENVKVQITRVKLNIGFAKIITQKVGASFLTGSDKRNQLMSAAAPHPQQQIKNGFRYEVGSKFTTTLNYETLSTFSKNKKKFIVLNVNGSIVFLKLKKDILTNQKNIDDKNAKVCVRIKISSKSENCAVGKILEMNPISSKQKSALVLKNIREMINHGLHFGEKAVKCHARMKNYVWLTSNTNTTLGQKGKVSSNSRSESGIGSAWNRRPLIKKGRHVINLLKTRRCLNQALNKLTKFALKGRTFLFIGTKKPAAGLVARASFFTKNSFYVNTRWLGGMLTNWKTICKSISKIRPILKEKQKVVREILERRQAIKTRLIKKAFLLRKKSKLILNKGRILLETLRKQKTLSFSNRGPSESELNVYTPGPALWEGGKQAKQLTTLRNDFINKGTQYIEKRQKLIQKRRELILQAQTLLLKEKGLELSLKHKTALNQLAIYAKKLREYKYLLILTSEIQNIKEASVEVDTKNPSLLSVSYTKLKEVLQTKEGISSTNSWILPNPPKEILNKMVLTCLQSSNETQTTVSLNKDGNVVGSVQVVGSVPQEKQFIICSTLLSKFSNFGLYIKSVIQSLIKSIQILENQLKAYASQLTQIKSTLQVYLNLKQKYVAELKLLKTKFSKERAIISIVRHKLKSFDAQKKLLKFLPRLRYLPTPQTKISEIVQILLSKIVDPKLKYPIENIYDQKFNSSAGGSKKLAAVRKKKWQRLEKYFGGIANMTKLTKSQISRNVAIIIGQKEEMNAVRECQKLGIKMFSIVDTNCDPNLCDHIIPANDDSRSSIKYILTKFITRIRLAQKLRARLVNTIYIK